MVAITEKLDAPVRESWLRIENWMARHAPAFLEILNEPASLKEIQKLERVIGLQLPEDFRESYMIHNGQKTSPEFQFNGGDLMSLDRILFSWLDWKNAMQNPDYQALKPDDGGLHIVNLWFSDGWIPFTFAGDCSHYCLDLNPGPQGRHGQIIELFSDNVDRPITAPNFRAFLANFANNLVAGNYTTPDSIFDYGSVWNFPAVPIRSFKHEPN